jgi:hypothetical protein
VNASPTVLTIVVVVCALLAIGLLSRQASYDIAGPLRNWLWSRDARRMAARKHFPAQLRRSYWNEAEYQRDRARLEALGYVVASSDRSEPYVTPPVWTGPGPPPRRRVPIHHVVYEHPGAS